MSVAVASTSTAVGNDANSLTITAPTGIQEGDLLVIVGVAASDASVLTSTGFTQSFVHTYRGFNAYNRFNHTVLYKIAVLADESAVNYTLSNSSSGQLGLAVMLRITGHTSGDPVFAFDTGTHDVGIASVQTFSFSTTRPSQQLSFLLLTAWSNNVLTGDVVAQNYGITSSDSNPTWTEVIDEDNFDVNGAVTDHGAAAFAYASSSDTSNITGYEFFHNVQESNTLGGHVFFTIQDPVSASGSNTLLTTDTTLFTQSGVSAASGTNTLLTTTAETFTQSGRGRQRTTWTDENGTNTVWVNEERL